VTFPQLPSQHGRRITQCQCSEGIRDAIQGHGGNGVSGEYGTGYYAETLNAAIQNVVYRGLDLGHLISPLPPRSWSHYLAGGGSCLAGRSGKRSIPSFLAVLVSSRLSSREARPMILKTPCPTDSPLARSSSANFETRFRGDGSFILGHLDQYDSLFELTALPEIVAKQYEPPPL
jgi:hypothetical protein